MVFTITRTRKPLGAAAIIAIVSMTWVVGRADAQVTTQRVSVPPSGEADGGSGYADMTPDARYVAFSSYARNLVPGDTNGSADVFLADRRSGAVTRVSVGNGGVQAQYPSTPPTTQGPGSSVPSISADGKRIAFESQALNFAPVASGAMNVFVRDVVAGTTTLLSTPAPGGTLASCDSVSPAISSDGRYVSFTSRCDSLVPNDTNFTEDVFVRDLQTGAIERVSVSSTEAQANGRSHSPAISDDGNYVVFVSDASNLWPNDTNGKSDVFMRDRAAGTTTVISYTSANRMGGGGTSRPSVSGDGTRIAFAAEASDLLPGDTNAAVDVFVRDMAVGTIQRVSVAAGGSQLALGGSQPSISRDGRTVAFESLSPEVVPSDTNASSDVFVRDTLAATTTRASVGASGEQADGMSFWPTLSGDGTAVSFESAATNLVTGDENALMDVFVRGVPAPPLPARPVITAPAPGSIVRTEAVTVRGLADVNTSVRLLEGSAIVGTALAAADRSWSIPVTFTAGAHTITAVANDGDDSPASSPVSFTIDLSAVDPVIVSPAQGAALRSSLVALAGTSAPFASVSLAEEGVEVATEAADANGSWSATATFLEGTHAITATATDAQGRVTSTAAPRTFTVDLTLPAVPLITAPAPGATITTPGVTVSGEGEPGARITIIEGSTPFGSTVTGEDGTWSTAIAFGDGPHTIKAVASDAAGNTSAASPEVGFTVNVDRAAPVLSFTTPNNSAFLPDTLMIEGTAADGGGSVARVLLTYVNAVTGARVATDREAACTCGASASWHDAPELEPGYYRVTGVAVDAAGNRSKTASISFVTL